MNFLAHPENTAGRPHVLKDHLRGVGTLARQFAEVANPLLAEPARWAELLHDLGKYRDAFQAYVREERTSNVETHTPFTALLWLSSSAGLGWLSPLPVIMPDCTTSANCRHWSRMKGTKQ
jgi:CRISPR-associated endonuclease Cas3-HD